MKITKQQLKNLIKEELETIAEFIKPFPGAGFVSAPSSRPAANVISRVVKDLKNTYNRTGPEKQKAFSDELERQINALVEEWNINRGENY